MIISEDIGIVFFLIKYRKEISKRKQLKDEDIGLNLKLKEGRKERHK